MKKITLILFLILTIKPAIAESTTPQNFTSTLPDTFSVEASPGSLSANINVDTGVLSNDIIPSFRLISNKESGKTLTQSWSCATTGAAQNAIFRVNTTTYVILTNYNVPPDVSSITNIKSGTAAVSSNPNAIAYPINAPSGLVNRLDISFDSNNNVWKLNLLKNGNITTSQTISVARPLSDTFSLDDEPGSYKATVTLSFDPT